MPKKSSSPIVFTIEREGVFHVAWTHSHRLQCGNATSAGDVSILRWKAKVQGTQHDLNKEGWLIDNNDLINYFRDTYSKKVKDFKSCETIAKESVYGLHHLVEKNGGSARYIRVSIQSIPDSWITAEWGCPIAPACQR